MEVEVYQPSPWGGLRCLRVTALLLRSQQQLHNTLIDLSSQHCTVLSNSADKHRDTAVDMTLGGPFPRLQGCSGLDTRCLATDRPFESG